MYCKYLYPCIRAFEKFKESFSRSKVIERQRVENAMKTLASEIL